MTNRAGTKPMSLPINDLPYIEFTRIVFTQWLLLGYMYHYNLLQLLSSLFLAESRFFCHTSGSSEPEIEALQGRRKV